MKQREIIATGAINNKGQLQMYMGELKAFCGQWKGARVVARFTVIGSGTSEALRGYYYNYVVPTMRRAMWEAGERLTEQDTERRLRAMSPIMAVERVDFETGEYSVEVREIAELSNAELIEHIETIRQLAAEEFSVFIDDPKTI